MTNKHIAGEISKLTDIARKFPNQLLDKKLGDFPYDHLKLQGAVADQQKRVVEAISAGQYVFADHVLKLTQDLMSEVRGAFSKFLGARRQGPIDLFIGPIILSGNISEICLELDAFTGTGEVELTGRKRRKQESASKEKRTDGSKDNRKPEERNVAVRDYLKAQPKDRHTKVTAAEIAKAIGASSRSVKATDAWKTYQAEWTERFGKSRSKTGKGRKPAVFRSAELDKLVAEQAEDAAQNRVRYCC